MRIVTLAVMRSSRWLSNDLTAGHRREESNLAGAGNYGIGFDVGVIDRGTDHPRRLEGVGVTLASLRQPRNQIVNGADACRRLDCFLRFADPFAYPGEILDLHASSSLMR